MIKILDELTKDIEEAKKIERIKKLEYLEAEANLKALEASYNLVWSNISADDIRKELKKREQNGTDKKVA